MQQQKFHKVRFWTNVFPYLNFTGQQESLGKLQAAIGNNYPLQLTLCSSKLAPS